MLNHATTHTQTVGSNVDPLPNHNDKLNKKHTLDYSKIINGLSENSAVFKQLLSGLTEEIHLWKLNPDKWCLLEIICHLHDEEIYDFRARTRHVLEKPTEGLPAIDPLGWVKNRKYIKQNYNDKLAEFLKEREQSVKWLQSLSNPKWDNTYEHAKFGKMTAKMFLSNWLAHDYLHIRQITKLKYDYLKQLTNENLIYGGYW
ncbi:DinB family protein [Aquimarina algiphila]|uniref:DinB family protein n=1 Tax=Aquimarina algiphila TaxID=2047982 RepID=UPI00232D40EE|nr:DinB family protein [Aquimarina algiphila]